MAQKLDDILSEVYGVGVVSADVITVVWAADRIEDVKHAKAELDRVNRIREKWGRAPAYVPYGHRLF